MTVKLIRYRHACVSSFNHLLFSSQKTNYWPHKATHSTQFQLLYHWPQLTFFITIFISIFFNVHAPRCGAHPLLLTAIKPILFQIFQFVAIVALIKRDKKQFLALSSSAKTEQQEKSIYERSIFFILLSHAAQLWGEAVLA